MVESQVVLVAGDDRGAERLCVGGAGDVGAVVLDALQDQVGLVDVEPARRLRRLGGLLDLDVGSWRDQDRDAAVGRRRVDGLLDRGETTLAVAGDAAAELVHQEEGLAGDDDFLDAAEDVGVSPVGDHPLAVLDGDVPAGVEPGGRVDADVADQGVRALQVDQGVIARQAVQPVVACASSQGVVADIAFQQVVPGVAGDAARDVVGEAVDVGRAGQHQGLDVVRQRIIDGGEDGVVRAARLLDDDVLEGRDGEGVVAAGRPGQHVAVLAGVDVVDLHLGVERRALDGRVGAAHRQVGQHVHRHMHVRGRGSLEHLHAVEIPGDEVGLPIDGIGMET